MTDYTMNVQPRGRARELIGRRIGRAACAFFLLEAVGANLRANDAAGEASSLSLIWVGQQPPRVEQRADTQD